MSRRKLLLILDDSSIYTTDLPSPLNLHLPLPHPPPPSHHQQPLSIPIPNPNPPFDSSIPLTFIVLLTALFFMAFFSLYLRCFSTPSPSSSSYLPTHPSKSCAHPDLLHSLPLVIYGGTFRQTDCVVCLSEFEEGETVKVLPLCHHVFHPECVDTWLSSHLSCPVCRSTLLS